MPNKTIYKIEKDKNQFEHQLLVSIINSSDDAILSKDTENIVMSWNYGAEVLYGYDASEIIGKHISILFPPHRLHELLDISGKVKSNIRIQRLETERLHKDGSIVHVSITVSPIKNDDGIVIGASTIACNISVQKQKEVELNRSLKDILDYKKALDESAIVAITDQFGIIKHVNDNFCKISKYSKKELIGQDHRIINSGYHPKKYIQTIWKTISSGKIWKGELRNKAKDGSIYWVDTTIVPFLNDKGKPYQYIAIRSDITQRKMAEGIQHDLEESLTSKAEEIISIFDRITDGFISLDKDFRYTYANKKIGEMTKRNPADLIGKYVWDEFPDAINSATYFAFEKAYKEQLFIHNIDYFKELDLWQENYIYPSPNGLSVFVRDITKQKIAEKEIIKSEKIYKTIASSIPGSYICLFDKDFRYMLVEGDLLEKLGYNKEKLQGNKMEDVLPAAIINEVLPQLKRVFKGETFTQEAKRNTIDLLYRFVPLKNEKDKVYAAMIVAIDVSEQKKAQREIADLNIGLEMKVKERTEQLETVNKELESFTYSVSHDLRAPLRIIDGFADMLVVDYTDVLDEEGQRLLYIVKTNAQKMGRLIDDLLNLSRLGRRGITKTYIDMYPLIQSAIQEQIFLQNKKVNISCKTILPAYGDDNLLRQVWVNLISNAIKYSSKNEQQEIEIDSRREGKNIIYSIKDNGVGFDMQYADKLFGVFQRMHKITEFDGTGVGLALVQKIILKHGGKIWADAAINKGATFYFSLPLKIQ